MTSYKLHMSNGKKMRTNTGTEIRAYSRCLKCGMEHSDLIREVQA